MAIIDAAAGRRAFERLSREFPLVLDEMKQAGRASFVRPDWAERNRDLETSLSPSPPSDFLRHPCIAFQMFVGERYLPFELPYVLPRLRHASLATEDSIGDPPRTRLPASGVVTSSNTIHHLFHLLRYQEEVGTRIADHQTVVEWGGGYGNLAKLYCRLHPGAPTYVLVDTPTFSAIQWLYLASTVGEERVVLCTQRSGIVPGRINIVPLGDLDKLSGCAADLFVSTWALNESTPQAQDYVVEREWFGARSLLLAMHQGDPLGEYVVGAGAREVPVGEFMPPQRYFVR